MMLDTIDSSSNSNGGVEAQQCGRDRLSELPDDVLLLVLDKLGHDVRQVARTCALSRRWRSLPLMLPRLSLSTDCSFLPAIPDPDTTTAPLPMRCLHQTTSKLTDALRFFLSTPAAGADGQRRDIRHLRLHFYLTKHRRRLHEIGRLVSAAVALGEVHALEVTLDTPENTDSVRAMPDDAVPLGYGRRFMRLLRAAPPAVVGSALRSLSLQNLCFRRAADLEGALRACAALETLRLTYCWFTHSSALRLDAPRSRLRVLVVTECFVERVDVVQAPELRELACDRWFCQACPVRFGPAAAPSLEKMTLKNKATPGQLSFKLSELLENANPLEYLHLDFVTRSRVWVQPENRSDLAVAFSKLKRLHVKNTLAAAASGISWIMFFTKAAPLLEYIAVRVCHDPVCDDGECACSDDGDHHQDLQWDMSQHFERRHLQTAKIRGGIDPDRDAGFLRLVVERAVNLELLVLDARITCPNCVAAKEQDPSLVVSRFPEDEDGIDAFVRQIKDGIPTSARITVRSPCNKEEYEY